MTARERTPDLYVLDTLADDIEDLATVVRVLNSDTMIGWYSVWGRHFTREEVVSALSRLITSDLVQVAVLTSDSTSLGNLAARQFPPGDYDEVWFAITPRGRLVHTNWHPDIPSESG